jgi:hypothetical protein
VQARVISAVRKFNMLPVAFPVLQCSACNVLRASTGLLSTGHAKCGLHHALLWLNAVTSQLLTYSLHHGRQLRHSSKSTAGAKQWTVKAGEQSQHFDIDPYHHWQSNLHSCQGVPVPIPTPSSTSARKKGMLERSWCILLLQLSKLTPGAGRTTVNCCHDYQGQPRAQNQVA